jgi:hypothetical protein
MNGSVKQWLILLINVKLCCGSLFGGRRHIQQVDVCCAHRSFARTELWTGAARPFIMDSQGHDQRIYVVRCGCCIVWRG